MGDFPAIAFITIDASRSSVWKALIDPQAIREFMFGASVQTDWKEGGPIEWKGDWEGKSYEDKGKILTFRPPQLLKYSHFSPLSGLPDNPENYHNVTIELSAEGPRTHVSLTQDNNPTTEARSHSEKNWKMTLELLKKYVESNRSGEASQAVTPS